MSSQSKPLKGEIVALQKELGEITTFKTDTEAICALKTSKFHARQNLRAEELEAIKKTLEII